MKIIYAIVILFAVMFVSKQGNSQNRITDSLNRILLKETNENKIADILLDLSKNYYETGQTEKSLQYAQDALNIAEKINYKKGIAFAKLQIAGNYINIGEFEKAEDNSNHSLILYTEEKDLNGIMMNYSNLSVLNYYKGFTDIAVKYAKKSLLTAKILKDTLKQAKIYNNLGLMYNNAGKFDSSAFYYFKALEIFKIKNDTEKIMGSFINIGNNYTAIGDTVKALYYLNPALKMSEELKNFKAQSIIFSGLANLYIKRNKPDSALHFLYKANKIDSANNDLYGLAINIKTIGIILKQKGKLNEALAMLETAADLQQKMGNEHGLIITNYEKADILFQRKRFQEAKTFALQSLQLAKKLKEPESTANVSLLLSAIYKELKNFEKAYTYLNDAKTLKDSIFNKSQVEIINELDIKYQTKEKETQINKLKYEKGINDIRYKKKMFQNRVIIFVSFLLIVLLALIYLNYRNNQKHKFNKIILKEIDYRNQLIAQNLHDGLSGYLHTLNDSLQRRNIQNGQLQFETEIVHKSQKELKLLLKQLSSAGYKSRYFELIEELKELSYFYETAGNLKINTFFDNQIDWKTVPYENKLHIYKLVQEFLANIKKHSQASEVNVQIIKILKKILISVEDNGKGFLTSDEPGKGNGLNNMHQRVKELKGNIEINSNPGKGTTVSMSIPY